MQTFQLQTCVCMSNHVHSSHVWRTLSHGCILYKWLCTAAAQSLQSCPTLCDPIDGSPSGSPVPGILQERTLEWLAISFSNAWKWKVKGKSLSRVWLLETPWTAAHQAPLSMGFSRQKYWSGVPIAFPGLCTKLYFTVQYDTEYSSMVSLFQAQDLNIEWSTNVAAAIQNAI